jgi:soluble lytic murein transglycosylase-like protein
LAAAGAEARIVQVQTADGLVWTNFPEPAAGVKVKPSKRAERWRPLIASAAARHGVDPGLVEAVIACESNFEPEAVSRAGACGLMQLMPATAREYGLTDLFDPAGNVETGTRHLAGLLRSFGGDRRLAIAAYNAGEGAVRRSGGMPPFAETMHYVEKVQSYFAQLSDAGSDSFERTPLNLAPAPPRGRIGSSPKDQSIRLGRDASGRIVMTNLPSRTKGGGR